MAATWGAAAAAVITMFSFTWDAAAADHPCAPSVPVAASALTRATPLADGGTRASASPLVELQASVLHPTALVGSELAAAKNFIQSSNRTMQQVNVTDAQAQVEKTLGQTPAFTALEKQRQSQSAACDAAYDKLLSAFADNVEAMAYPIKGRQGLAVFASWYYDARRKPTERQAAEPVVQAELAFEKVCLVNDIPKEMNPDLVRRAVGIFSFENQPFCTGFRDTDSSVITARHCFVVEDGSLQPWTAVSLAGRGAMWFQYEAEPSERYQVCRSALPNTATQPFLPAQDNIRVEIAKTQTPPVKWKWSSVPLVSGTSLYLRGNFPFGNGKDLLAHMRSTALGGCAAFNAHDRCMFHGCQTTPSMSGAPVFYRPDSPGNDELQIVGLHLGIATISSSTEPGGTVCSGSDGMGFSLLNFAYQPRGL